MTLLYFPKGVGAVCPVSNSLYFFLHLKPKECRATQRNQSWKLQLIATIEDVLLYSPDKESFMHNMEYEGYKVNWSDTKNTLPTPLTRVTSAEITSYTMTLISKKI